MRTLPILPTDTPDPEAIRAELQRILTSDTFSNAPTLSRFLRYVTEQRIYQTKTRLKEYTIGVEVFRRGVRFDPHIDTIVRVQARRLRDRLHRYYENEGHADPLRITVPKGHYDVEITPAVPATSHVDRAATLSARRVFPDLSGRSISDDNPIPAPRTPIVGREREVAELGEMLTDGSGPRLVTLTGTAGSGKTRLAMEVALRLQKQMSSRVTYAALANVSDAQMLALTLLRMLGLRVGGNRQPTEIICRHLRSIEGVPYLILDNFEQLVSAAPMIGSLLDACLSLRVLVTSRTVLRLYGEHEYPVAPLSVPENGSMPLEQLAKVPAVDLFVRRVTAVRSGFSLTASNRDAVLSICRHFEGLPLGLELAAAQCRHSTLSQMLADFPERLSVPPSRVSDVPVRHCTLRHAIEWSHQLLAEPERRLFRRLSVFSGGFTLEAAEAVANGSGDLDTHLTSAVAHLHDNNLLQLSLDSCETRYAMLETIREYGLQQLNANGERDTVCRAYSAYYLALAEEGTQSLDDPARNDWLRRCDVELDNLGTALDHMVECADGRSALRLVRALYPYWEQRGRPAAACRALLKVLKQFKPQIAPALWSQVACCAAAMEARMGMLEAAMDHGEQALSVARAYRNRAVEITALHSIAALDCLDKRYRNAAAGHERCLSLCEISGLEREIAIVLGSLAIARLALGEHETAHGLLGRAFLLFRKRTEWRAADWFVTQLETVRVAAELHSEARKYHLKSIGHFLQPGNVSGTL